MKSKETTIEKTVLLDLCVSCGICKAVCSQKCIEMYCAKGQYYPKIKGQCNLCGLCLKLCPGIDFMVENTLVIEKRGSNYDQFVGPVIKSYICYTKNDRIRDASTSGGMVTSIIVDLINKGDYKGAFVLPAGENNYRPVKVIYMRSIDGIIKAAKSKYLPASVENVVEHLKNGADSCIIVGTPCQIHGIKKYLQFYNINQENVLFLGLFCEKTLNYNFLDYYEWKYGRGKKIKLFNYRDKEYRGWPGDTTVVFDNGEKQFLDRRIRMNLKRYFQLKRCLFCADKLNMLADISFGDCYIMGEESQHGQSNIIIRTQKGVETLKNVEENYVLKEVLISQISHSQNIYIKQKNLELSQIFAKYQNYNPYPDLKINYSNISISQIREYKNLCRFISYGKNNNFIIIDLINNILSLKDHLKRNIKRLIKKDGVFRQ
jgi:coenzyme F420 hydrogenase subunit beta